MLIIFLTNRPWITSFHQSLSTAIKVVFPCTHFHFFSRPVKGNALLMAIQSRQCCSVHLCITYTFAPTFPLFSCSTSSTRLFPVSVGKWMWFAWVKQIEVVADGVLQSRVAYRTEFQLKLLAREFGRGFFTYIAMLHMCWIFV